MPLPTILKPVLALLFAVIALGGSVDAQAVSNGSPEAEGINQQQVRQLIEQLDAAQFVTRQRASGELTRLGKKAIPAIEQAALVGSSEVANRSISLLKAFTASPDEETAQMAVAALKHLAACENDFASQRASDLLQQLRRMVGPGRLEDAAPMPRGLPAEGMERSVRLSNQNGKRTIDVTENGQRVVAAIGAGGEVSVTWHLADGQLKTVKAATSHELKQKDPATFSKLQELIRIAENGPIAPAGMRQVPLPGPAVPANAPQRASVSGEQLQQRFGAWLQDLNAAINTDRQSAGGT